MPLSVRLRGTFLNTAYNPVARFLGFDAALGSVYNCIDQGNFALAHAKLQTAEHYLLPHSHTCRAKYYEVAGDLEFSEGHYPAAYNSYQNAAICNRGEPFVTLKSAAAAVAACQDSTLHACERARYHRRALEIIGGNPQGHKLPRWGLILAGLYHAQLVSPAEGGKILGQLVEHTRCNKFNHAYVAWETLSTLPDFPRDVIWAPMVAALYGDPTHLLPCPRDIRWRFTTPATAPFNCSTLALDHGISLNPQLSQSQKTAAAACLWCHTPATSGLHQWADAALRRHAPDLRRHLRSAELTHTTIPPSRGPTDYPLSGLEPSLA